MEQRDWSAEAEAQGQVADLAAELEQLRRESADSQMQAVSARGRISILEKAFSAAQEVRGQQWLVADGGACVMCVPTVVDSPHFGLWVAYTAAFFLQLRALPSLLTSVCPCPPATTCRTSSR